MYVQPFGRSHRSRAVVLAFVLASAGCSGAGDGAATPTSAPALATTQAPALAATTAPSTVATTAATTTAVATTPAPSTTTTVPVQPISHGDLWDLVDGPALLTASDGTTLLADLGRFGAPNIGGESGGVDLGAAATAAGIVGDAAFVADRSRARGERSVWMYLTATPEGAASLLAAAGPAFPDGAGPEPIATGVVGAMAFDHRAASDLRAVQLSFARGPVMVVVNVARWDDTSVEAARAVAEAVATAIAARIERRLTTCTSPCRGVAGGAPTWPAAGPALRRPVGTCEVYNSATADFRPPATYRSDVPCTEEHDVEHVATVSFPDVALLPRAGMNVADITPEMNRAAVAVQTACLDATAAARASRDLTVSYVGPVAGTPEEVAAGDVEVVCTLDVGRANLERLPPVPAG